MAAAPIVCLPGLGADARLFQPQLTRFASAVVPDWPAPTADVRSVADLAGRLRSNLHEQGLWTADTVLVGFSFGGQVAWTMTQQAIEACDVLPRGIVLVSAPRRTAHITRAFRFQVAASRLLPGGLIRWGARNVVSARFARACGLDAARTEDLRKMADDLDVKAFKRLSHIATRWRFEAADEQRVLDAGVQVRHVHSRSDFVIPPPGGDTPDVDWVDERAHLLTWSHAELVGDVIGSLLEASR